MSYSKIGKAGILIITFWIHLLVRKFTSFMKLNNTELHAEFELYCNVYIWV